MPTLPEPEIALSPDQTAALAALFAALRGPNREAVLAGAAGTGKTTLMRAVLAPSAHSRTSATKKRAMN